MVRGGWHLFRSACTAAGVVVGALALSAQTVFRTTVDVIAVDVQVVDGEGNPIGRIGPESFEVSINRPRRKIV